MKLIKITTFRTCTYSRKLTQNSLNKSNTLNESKNKNHSVSNLVLFVIDSSTNEEESMYLIENMILIVVVGPASTKIPFFLG